MSVENSEYELLFSFPRNSVTVFQVDGTYEFLDPSFLQFLQEKGIDFSQSSRFEHERITNSKLEIREFRRGFERASYILESDGKGEESILRLYKKTGIADRDFYKLTHKEKKLFGALEKTLKIAGITNKNLRVQRKWEIIERRRLEHNFVENEASSIVSDSVYNSHKEAFLDKLKSEVGLDLTDIFSRSSRAISKTTVQTDKNINTIKRIVAPIETDKSNHSNNDVKRHIMLKLPKPRTLKRDIFNTPDDGNGDGDKLFVKEKKLKSKKTDLNIVPIEENDVKIDLNIGGKKKTTLKHKKSRSKKRTLKPKILVPSSPTKTNKTKKKKVKVISSKTVS